jgi:hypothetical protein
MNFAILLGMLMYKCVSYNLVRARKVSITACLYCSTILQSDLLVLTGLHAPNALSVPQCRGFSGHLGSKETLTIPGYDPHLDTGLVFLTSESLAHSRESV